jgi:adenylate cyclase
LEEQRVERRLAAILAADVAGYSRLMGADEEGTLRRLKAHRRALVDPKIGEHHGRVVKTTGDGMLVEFSSVVDAVRCAVEVQGGMVERNSDVPVELRIEFRVGINVGDIIIDGDDIFGDGVNIAARLEGLAEPGGICISRTVLTQTRGKLSFEVEDAGEQMLKNIAQAVHIFRILSERVGESYARGSRLALPARPSIAVLPFQNMSGDPEQEYFADGIAEDIITALSKFRWFFVIARNSTFTYKGKAAVDVKRVGRELGVRYVLEGSVRKSGNRVRVTGQLIEAPTGNHLWAERYDRDLGDIFAVQDEITQNVVGAIEPELQRYEFARVHGNTAEEFNAYDLFQRGRYHLHKFTMDGIRVAAENFRQAIALAPDLVEAYTGMARAVVSQYLWGAWETADLTEGERWAHRALAIDDRETGGHYILSLFCALRGDLDSALTTARAAIDLNPNLSLAQFRLGQVLGFLGRFEEGIAAIDVGLRLSPHDPQASFWLTNKGWAQYLLGRYEDAVKTGLAAKHSRPLPFVYRLLIASYGQLDRNAEATTAISEAKTAAAASKGMGVLGTFNPLVMRLYADPAHLARIDEGLRKGGLPEGAERDIYGHVG